MAAGALAVVAADGLVPGDKMIMLGDNNAFLVVLLPTIAMVIGSFGALCARIPEKLQACTQNFSAGLLISAVAGELYPLISPKKTADGSGPTDHEIYAGLVGGFVLGLIFMFGLEKLTDSMEEEEEETSQQFARQTSIVSPPSPLSPLLAEGDTTEVMEGFQEDAKAICEETERLTRLTEAEAPDRDDMDETIHRLEFRTHKALRNLALTGPLDSHNQKRLQFHTQELITQARELARQAPHMGVSGKRRCLKEFQATLEHIHGHAERGRFRVWAPAPLARGQDGGKNEHVPWPLVCAVVVDAAVDGLLIGLAFSAAASAGWAMSMATCIEMGFLGLSFCATLRNATRSPVKLILLSLAPPMMLLVAGVSGNTVGVWIEGYPGFFIGLISFSIVALLFLVTRELLVEAQEIAGDSALVNSMFFVGLLAGILMEKILDAN